MTINSVMAQGLAGMQSGQREMVKAAQEIASAALPSQGAAVVPGLAPVAEAHAARQGAADLVEPLVELRRQEHLFTASAKVVSVADETLGSLIDVTS